MGIFVFNSDNVYNGHLPPRVLALLLRHGSHLGIAASFFCVLRRLSAGSRAAGLWFVAAFVCSFENLQGAAYNGE